MAAATLPRTLTARPHAARPKPGPAPARNQVPHQHQCSPKLAEAAHVPHRRPAPSSAEMYFVRVHIYALTGILTHARDLAGDRRAAFSIVLVGNQTAESDRAVGQLMTCETATHIRGSGRLFCATLNGRADAGWRHSACACACHVIAWYSSSLAALKLVLGVVTDGAEARAPEEEPKQGAAPPRLSGFPQTW